MTTTCIPVVRNGAIVATDAAALGTQFVFACPDSNETNRLCIFCYLTIVSPAAAFVPIVVNIRQCSLPQSNYLLIVLPRTGVKAIANVHVIFSPSVHVDLSETVRKPLPSLISRTTCRLRPCLNCKKPIRIHERIVILKKTFAQFGAVLGPRRSSSVT